MLGTERRKLIFQYIYEHGSCKVKDLAKQFACSTSTVRRDLEMLEREGKIERSYGGAVLKSEEELSYFVRESLHRAEKQRIGALTASLINPGEAVMIDAGTTTAEVAKHLVGKRGITVITDALNIAAMLENASGITVVLVGGVLRGTTHSLVGPIAEQNVRMLNFDKVIIGATGIDASGITHASIEAVPLKQLLLQVGKQKIVVADYSKLGKRALATIAPVEAIDILVTNKEAPEEVVEAIRSKGVEVYLA